MEEHGHYTYENETAADARSYACEWEDTPQGNRVTGVIGAMLGAMIGAIPWFIASTFTSNFIGWLGFLQALRPAMDTGCSEDAAPRGLQ